MNKLEWHDGIHYYTLRGAETMGECWVRKHALREGYYDNVATGSGPVWGHARGHGYVRAETIDECKALVLALYRMGDKP